MQSFLFLTNLYSTTKKDRQIYICLSFLVTLKLFNYPHYFTLYEGIPAFTAQTTKTAVLELNKGDMVQHTAFGRGMVLSVLKMGGDALLEIAFDDIGTKKLMSKTASAHMKRL